MSNFISQGSGREFVGKIAEVPLTLWLPDSVEKIVEALAAERETTRSGLLRHILFRHLYGTFDLHALAKRGNNDYSGWHQSRDAIMFSRSPIRETEKTYQTQTLPNVAGLSHNVANLKVFVSAQIKADLSGLAIARGLLLSAYARHVVMTDLLGHTAVLPLEQPPEGLDA